jgi:hypothetical protein
MVGDTIFFLMLICILSLIQGMVMSVMWQRFQRTLQTQEPRTRRVVISAFGPDRAANARALARHTRLDLAEIDDIVERRQTGPLPLPLSIRDANRLIADLRRLGGAAESEPRKEGSRQAG